MLMALLMSPGGGITRDILVEIQVPGALTNPAYITLCLIFGAIGYSLAFAKGQLFREGLFQFATSFSLPLYTIVGAQKGVSVGLPVAGVLALSVIAPTAGRWYVDVSCGVPPKQSVRGEWFVTVALLTGIIWVLCDTAGLDTWLCAAIAFSRSATRSACSPSTSRGRNHSPKNRRASTCTTTAARSSAASSRASRRREMEYLGLTTEEQST